MESIINTCKDLDESIERLESVDSDEYLKVHALSLRQRLIGLRVTLAGLTDQEISINERPTCNIQTLGFLQAREPAAREPEYVQFGIVDDLMRTLKDFLVTHDPDPRRLFAKAVDATRNEIRKAVHSTGRDDLASINGRLV